MQSSQWLLDALGNQGWNLVAIEGQLDQMCVLTWPPEGEGCLSIIRTTKSSNLYPPPLGLDY
jgi:hypothetical protein